MPEAKGACSHVIAACSVSGLDAASYVSQYFTNEAAAQTWFHEIYGIGILGPFTQKKIPIQCSSLI